MKRRVQVMGVVVTIVVAATSIASVPASAAEPTASVVQINAPTPIYGRVDMHGSGFVPNVGVTFKPCDVTDPSSGFICLDSPPFGLSVMADANGEFDFSWPAGASVSDTWWFGQFIVGGGGRAALFSPVVYDPMDQSIAIRQRIPFSGGAIVDLDGTHWPPNTGVTVLHCSAGGCVHPSVVPGGVVQTTSWIDGSFTTPVKLRRMVRGIDCYAARCWLSASGGFAPTRTADIDLVMARSGWTAAVGYYNDAREGDEFGCAPVILTKLSTENVIVAYHTFPIDASPGSDYAVTAGSLLINAGQFLGCARVNLIDDSVVEGTEMIGVHLDAISGPAVFVNGGRDSYIFLHDDE
jgi:Calx-beta domain